MDEVSLFFWSDDYGNGVFSGVSAEVRDLS